MTKLQLQRRLVELCKSLDLPQPNDLHTLTKQGLEERIASLRTAEEPAAVPSSEKAHNAQQFAIRYAEMVRRARADRRDKEAHDAISEGPKFIARNFLAPGEQVITQGERIWLVDNKKQRVPLEETNLSW